MRRVPSLRSKPDPTITLINVVFLMLTFFLVAGTMAPSPPSDVRLVSLDGADPVVPPDVLAVTADGRTLGQGRAVDPAAYVSALPPEAAGIVRLMPDRDLPARDLIRIARELQAAGAVEVRLTGERGQAQ
ncbi:ExbD/TolR family protein [Szabonella alba]|uniref:Biopolymer transporter ExbD n=1 Tax=Szabonella alba TaxID=2804194 RepID=A0A8K0V863_9RHOB|nr:biopolymer transporter ExbD [Szabonella alba]MBL4916916.1 biopolymer transporter ExbD [Szabonella alba]